MSGLVGTKWVANGWVVTGWVAVGWVITGGSLLVLSTAIAWIWWQQRGKRALDDKDEWPQPVLLGEIPVLHEVVAVLVGEHRIVEVDLRQAGDGPQQHVLDARLRGRGDRH